MQKKKLRKIVLILTVAVVSLVLTLSGPAAAKSVYFAANHHTSAFDAWNINPNGTVTKQATYTLSYATDPAGVAIHNGKNLLFLTSEFSGGVEIVDPVTLTYYGVSPGPSDLAGIDVDDFNDLVYAVRRMTNLLYIYKWNDVTKQLIEQDMISLPGCSQALGIALDEIRNILWVADTPNQKVRAYDLNSSPIVEASDMSFTPGLKPVDIAVDRKRNLVYSVSMYGGAYLPPGAGSLRLSKWDVVNEAESISDMAAHGVGVAVDEVSGYVYVTHGANIGDNLTVWDTSTSPFTNIQTTEPIGNPAGITIGNASYNPLSLAKNNTVQGTGIYIDQTFTYKISFANDNLTNINNVTVVDTLPAELDYDSSSPEGFYDMTAHTVTWNQGTVAANQSVNIDLVVKVNNQAQTGSTIYNYCTVECDETPPTTVIGEDPDNPSGEPGSIVIEPPFIEVSVDIKPGSCPNPLTLKSKGVLPVAILGSADFDVTQIDPASIKIAYSDLPGVSVLRWSLKDVATPFEGEPCDCQTLEADGYLDLSLKFSNQEARVMLGLDEVVGQTVPLKMTGKLMEEFGGDTIEGTDCVRVQ